MKLIPLLKETYQDWQKNKASLLGAGLAYFGAFSLAPLLIVLLGIAGLVYRNSNQRTQLVDQLGSWLGSGSVDLIKTALEQSSKPGLNHWEVAIGLVVSLLGAIGLLKQLKEVVNQIWEQKIVAKGIGGFIREELALLFLLIGSGSLVIISIGLSTVITTLSAHNFLFNLSSIFIQIVSILISLLILLAVCAVLFRFLPTTSPAWSTCLWAALVTSLLLSLGRIALTFYLGRTAFGSIFGAASTLAALLFWLYYAAQIFLFGVSLGKVLTLQKSSLAKNPLRQHPYLVAVLGVSLAKILKK